MALDGPGRVNGVPITAEEEEELRALSARPDIYEAVAKSIAPSIYGSLGGCVYKALQPQGIYVPSIPSYSGTLVCQRVPVSQKCPLQGEVMKVFSDYT